MYHSCRASYNLAEVDTGRDLLLGSVDKLFSGGWPSAAMLRGATVRAMLLLASLPATTGTMPRKRCESRTSLLTLSSVACQGAPAHWNPEMYLFVNLNIPVLVLYRDDLDNENHIYGFENTSTYQVKTLYAGRHF